MTKSRFLFLMAAASVASASAWADAPQPSPAPQLALKCYAFFGVKYRSTNYDGTSLEPAGETSKVMLEKTAPIVNDHQIQLTASNDQIAYDATYDTTPGASFFRLSLTDKTTGQETEYFGPVGAVAEGLGGAVFLNPSKDSKLKITPADLEFTPVGDMDPATLRIDYLTAQCEKVTQ